MSVVTDLISGFTSDSPKAPPEVKVWQPANMGAADTSFYGGVQNNLANNPYVQNQGLYQGILNKQLSNPYAAGMQNAANASGRAYSQVGQQAMPYAAQLGGSAQSMLGAGQSLWNTAQDPQQALYDRTAQQLQDQIRAGQAARGITQSGYGAGLENKAMSDFNIDWQNQQLNRQLAGAQGLAAMNSGAGQGFAQAGQLGTAGAQALGMGGQMPYAAYGQGLGDQYNALAGYGQQVGNQGQGLSNASLSQLLSYMGLGAGQSNQQGQFDVTNWQNQNDYIAAKNARNAAQWGSIGNLGDSFLGGVGQGFSGQSKPFGAGWSSKPYSGSNIAWGA